jgi:hypothetical protein
MLAAVDTGAAHVEEADESLGELLAVVGVGDDASPRLAHALAADDGLGREAREDLDDEVVGEFAEGEIGTLLLGAILVHHDFAGTPERRTGGGDLGG